MAPRGRTATILIVEDDPALRSLYRRALRTAGYIANGVEDGFDALQFVENTLPDLLVLDMSLPRLAGADVHADLKSRAETRGIPTVVVTGGDVDGLHRDDFACVMQKPVTAERLIAAVEKCLRERTDSVVRGGDTLRVRT